MQVTTYKDVKLFVWLIPCINIINYYLTYRLNGYLQLLKLPYLPASFGQLETSLYSGDLF